MVFLGRILIQLSVVLPCCLGVAEVEEYIAPNGECAYMCFNGKLSECITGPYDNVIQMELSEAEYEESSDCRSGVVNGRVSTR